MNSALLVLLIILVLGLYVMLFLIWQAFPKEIRMPTMLDRISRKDASLEPVGQMEEKKATVYIPNQDPMREFTEGLDDWHS